MWPLYPLFPYSLPGLVGGPQWISISIVSWFSLAGSLELWSRSKRRFRDVSLPLLFQVFVTSIFLPAHVVSLSIICFIIAVWMLLFSLKRDRPSLRLSQKISALTFMTVYQVVLLAAICLVGYLMVGVS